MACVFNFYRKCAIVIIINIKKVQMADADEAGSAVVSVPVYTAQNPHSQPRFTQTQTMTLLVLGATSVELPCAVDFSEAVAFNTSDTRSLLSSSSCKNASPTGWSSTASSTLLEAMAMKSAKMERQTSRKGRVKRMLWKRVLDSRLYRRQGVS